MRWICVRKGGGLHDGPTRALVSVEGGLHGDRWAIGEDPDPERQITLMRADVATLVAAGRLPPRDAGDNFGVDLDLSETSLPAGTLLRVGGAVVEVSVHPHTGCTKFRDRFGDGALRWIDQPSMRPLRLRGVNCIVRSAGVVAVGDEIERVT